MHVKNQKRARVRPKWIWMTVDHNNEPPQQPRQTTTTTTTSQLLRRLWKGMTLPFPMLGMWFAGQDDDSSSSSSSSDLLSKDHGVGLSLSESLIAISLYLLTGIVGYSCVFEHWSIVDSLYASVGIFTTVGYGDLHCTNTNSKLFTCFFGCGGIACLGLAISSIGSNMLTANMQALQVAQQQASQNRILNLFDHPHHHPASETNVSAEDCKDQGVSSSSSSSSSSSVVEPLLPVPSLTSNTFFRHETPVLLKFIPAMLFLVLGGMFMGMLEGWNVVDSMYYALVTAVTIGFGDVAPSTPYGRAWAIMFIPLAVAAAGELLGNAAAAFIGQRQDRLYRFYQSSEHVTMEHLMAMDANDNGQVSREEYVAFMLLEMGLVDRQQLDKLHAQFERLDVTESGYLDRDDLKLLAELRGAKVLIPSNSSSIPSSDDSFV